MIASLVESELSFGSCTVPVMRRDAEPALQRMAGQLFSHENGNDEEAAAARARATENLLRTIRQLSRPMGGKPWTNRDELYER